MTTDLPGELRKLADVWVTDINAEIDLNLRGALRKAADEIDRIQSARHAVLMDHQKVIVERDALAAKLEKAEAENLELRAKMREICDHSWEPQFWFDDEPMVCPKCGRYA